MKSAEIINEILVLTEKNKSLEDKIISLGNELSLYQQRCEQYAEAYDRMEHQLRELIRNRFGKKSERFIDDPEHPQLSLFKEDHALFATQEEMGKKTEETVVKSHARKKRKANKDIPVRVEIIPVSDEQKTCSCGACKTVIRYEIKNMLNFQPAIHEIIEQRREVVACANGCDGGIVTAPAPLHILPKVKATEEFLAFLIVSKLEDRQPLYHLEAQLRTRSGIDCSRQSMARWLIELMVPLKPIYNLLKDYIIDYDVASCDATTLQVLNEPNRPAETKSYVYCVRGGPPGNAVILYDYNDKLHKQFVKDWFLDFKGYLHVDGDNFFELIGEIANLVNCMAHARRKFEPIAQGAKGKGLAKIAMQFFKSLYKIEREAKDKHMSAEERFTLRQQKSMPLLNEFKAWLDKMQPTVLPKSPLGKAMQYTLNLWPGLTRFLEDGRLEIDNNLTEQEIKPLVIARKNFLFAASVDGAKALCMHLSFIRTAKAHGLDPYHFYVKLLKSIPHCKTVDDYEKLLPWHIMN